MNGNEKWNSRFDAGMPNGMPVSPAPPVGGQQVGGLNINSFPYSLINNPQNYSHHHSGAFMSNGLPWIPGLGSFAGNSINPTQINAAVALQNAQGNALNAMMPGLLSCQNYYGSLPGAYPAGFNSPAPLQKVAVEPVPLTRNCSSTGSNGGSGQGQLTTLEPVTDKKFSAAPKISNITSAATSESTHSESNGLSLSKSVSQISSPLPNMYQPASPQQPPPSQQQQTPLPNNYHFQQQQPPYNNNGGSDKSKFNMTHQQLGFDLTTYRRTDKYHSSGKYQASSPNTKYPPPPAVPTKTNDLDSSKYNNKNSYNPMMLGASKKPEQPQRHNQQHVNNSYACKQQARYVPHKEEKVYNPSPSSSSSSQQKQQQASNVHHHNQQCSSNNIATMSTTAATASALQNQQAMYHAVAQQQQIQRRFNMHQHHHHHQQQQDPSAKKVFDTNVHKLEKVIEVERILNEKQNRHNSNNNKPSAVVNINNATVNNQQKQANSSATTQPPTTSVSVSNNVQLTGFEQKAREREQLGHLKKYLSRFIVDNAYQEPPSMPVTSPYAVSSDTAQRTVQQLVPWKKVMETHDPWPTKDTPLPSHLTHDQMPPVKRKRGRKPKIRPSAETAAAPSCSSRGSEWQPWLSALPSASSMSSSFATAASTAGVNGGGLGGQQQQAMQQEVTTTTTSSTSVVMSSAVASTSTPYVFTPPHPPTLTKSGKRKGRPPGSKSSKKKKLSLNEQPGPSTSRSSQQQNAGVTYVTVDRRFKIKDTRIIDMSLMRKPKKPPVLTPSSSGRAKQQIPPPPRKVTFRASCGETALHSAARHGYVELIRYYLDHKLVDINRKTNAGYSPLHEAACHSQVKAAEVLIAYGADVNVQSDEGQKPLHDAVAHDCLEIVVMLLANGADLSLHLFSGTTALSLAKSERMRDYLNDHIKKLSLVSKEYVMDAEKHRWAIEPLPKEDELVGYHPLAGAPEEVADDQLDFIIMDTQPPPCYYLLPMHNNDEKMMSSNYYKLSDLLAMDGRSRADFLLEQGINIMRLKAKSLRNVSAKDPHEGLPTDGEARIEMVACELSHKIDCLKGCDTISVNVHDKKDKNNNN